MRSSLPKVLHPVAGRPMVFYSVEAARAATNQKPVLIVGHGAQQVKETIGEAAEYVHQHEQLGTGHAVRQAERHLKGKADHVLVISADMPLLASATLRQLISTHKSFPGPITMLTVLAEDPRGFGRVLRDQENNVIAIVEEADATPEQLAIRELNAGAYCFSSGWLWDALARIEVSPKGEYYLTDLVEIAVADGLPVQAIIASDPTETLGINTREHLAEANAIMATRLKYNPTLSP